jgi:hypothetical protein
MFASFRVINPDEFSEFIFHFGTTPEPGLKLIIYPFSYVSPPYSIPLSSVTTQSAL